MTNTVQFSVVESSNQNSTPIVFLHGFLGSPHSWSTLVETTQHTRSIALATLPGHGTNVTIPHFNDFFSIVDAFVKDIPFHKPMLLVGYSMGARIALAAALRHPTKFVKAILIGVNPGLLNEQERSDRQSWEESLATKVTREGLASFVQEWEKLPLFASQQKLPTLLLEKQRQQRLLHTPQGIAWAIRTLGLGRMPSLWNQLLHTKIPLYFVTGSLDQKYTGFAQHAASLSSKIHSICVPSVGHNVVLEDPLAIATLL